MHAHNILNEIALQSITQCIENRNHTNVQGKHSETTTTKPWTAQSNDEARNFCFSFSNGERWIAEHFYGSHMLMMITAAQEMNQWLGYV